MRKDLLNFCIGLIITLQQHLFVLLPMPSHSFVIFRHACLLTAGICRTKEKGRRNKDCYRLILNHLNEPDSNLHCRSLYGILRALSVVWSTRGVTMMVVSYPVFTYKNAIALKCLKSFCSLNLNSFSSEVGRNWWIMNSNSKFRRVFCVVICL